jgi:hypothetical protein
MEPIEAALKQDGKQLRLVLVLGKFRVTERHDSIMKLALGGSTTMEVLLPEHVDVKSGDILTLYTEVLYANPGPPPIQ